MKIFNIVLFLGLIFIVHSPCLSQTNHNIMDVVNDKDYYYSELYTVHETKLKVRGVNLLKAILKRMKELKIYNLSEICGNRLNEFQSIEGALPYFRLECKADEHFDKVIVKFGIVFIQKNIREISTEFFKIHSTSELKETALPIDND